jgi:hypothetical protein
MRSLGFAPNSTNTTGYILFPERIYPVAKMKSALSERFDILKRISEKKVEIYCLQKEIICHLKRNC